MKTLRQVHLYLGCLFAPLMIYFALSGAWQVFRLNDLPEEDGGTPSALRTFLHSLSNPHTHSTMPGLSSKVAHSVAFDWMAVATSIGIIATAGIGLALAWKYTRSPKLVLLAIGAGLVLPFAFLALH
jgi:hypothetical protein